MNRLLNNARLFVIVMALFAVAFTIWYDARYVWPVQKCEQRQAWWDPKDRQCVAPTPIWRITGRAVPSETPAAAPSR